MRILITGSLLFLLAPPLMSEEAPRYYDIELVVFESLEGSTESNEIWPTAKQLVVPENAAVLGRKYEGKLPPEYDSRLLFNSLPVKDYKLTEEIESLKASEQYRLLLHTGWRQPGLPKKQAVSVYFKHAVSDRYGEPDQRDSITAETNALPAGATALANLEGLVTIVLSRYLHLDVEMLYKRNPTDVEVDMFDSSFLEDRSGKESVFYLQQNRRMRSKETHYIDHPVIGMLVRITPYQIVSKAPAAGKTRTN